MGLAVASTEIRFEPSRPDGIVTDLTVGSGRYNLLRVEPVQWNDWPPQEKPIQFNQIIAEHDIEIRWAEPSLSHVPLRLH